MSAGFYNQAELKPHKSRYWLHAEPDEAAEAKMAALTTLYAQAPALVEAGARGLAIDEMTGLQALERKHPTRPMDPGCVERREFEYIQRGTLTLIAHVDVAQDTGIAPSLGPTRTEEDCMPHIAHTLTSDPEAHRWHFVVDNPIFINLQARILAFIQYFNATMAKPFKWTYGQKPLYG